ncbi:uncharacterized protein N7459_001128 [Penicillium hispanicum]|uniref:uncharacterized protein n=1 Tax=Penicillium hispanicum TaxID=1080232 RepID=UPI0025400954|nr:uncharacterized protein N7459_001128 [Penicillium hispanicum]KAJ5594920.1 hypothetical protein N7459_001128 [Penicillium hispanicum]
MPAPIEIVEPVAVVRDLRDDEKLVCDDFERHTSHCTQCALSLERFNNNLCERGYLLAVDVTKYLYSESGKHFSVVDKESGKLRRVKLLRDSSFVRTLLDSIEAGMRLRRGRAPAVRPPSREHESTYEIRSRRPVVEQVRPRSRTPEATSPPDEIIERSPSGTKRHVIVYQSPRGSPNRNSPSRGSLYTTDHMDRVERRTSRVYRRSDYYK